MANAIEYNREGKSVKVTVWKEDAVLHISIADRRHAASPSRSKTRLFERFHQLDQGASKKHKGHGLGLCITKAIVEMLGGKIFVAQPAAGGSLFTVVIPEASGAPAMCSPSTATSLSLKRGAAFRGVLYPEESAMIGLNTNSHYLLPGNLFAHHEEYQVLTVLGSCVSVCFWDPAHGDRGHQPLHAAALERRGACFAPVRKYRDYEAS